MLAQLPAPPCRALELPGRSSSLPGQFERRRNSSSSASEETQRVMDRPQTLSTCSHRGWMLLPTLSPPAVTDEGSSLSCAYPCWPALCVPPRAMVGLMCFILLAGVIEDGFCTKTGSISHPWGQDKSPAPAVLEQVSPGLDMGEDTSVTPLCRRVFFATLLTTWSAVPLRAERCLLCSRKTPAQAGAGEPGRCHTPTGTLGWSLVGVRVPTPPNLSAQGLLPPLHPNLPGDIPSLSRPH